MQMNYSMRIRIFSSSTAPLPFQRLFTSLTNSPKEALGFIKPTGNNHQLKEEHDLVQIQTGWNPWRLGHDDEEALIHRPGTSLQNPSCLDLISRHHQFFFISTSNWLSNPKYSELKAVLSYHDLTVTLLASPKNALFVSIYPSSAVPRLPSPAHTPSSSCFEYNEKYAVFLKNIADISSDIYNLFSLWPSTVLPLFAFWKRCSHTSTLNVSPTYISFHWFV